MENRVINIEDMSYEEMSLVQERINQRKQKSMEERLVAIEKEFIQDNNYKGIIVTLKDEIVQMNKEIELQNAIINGLKQNSEETKVILEEISVETNKVTKTLLTHGIERRKLENNIHRLIYKEVPKSDSLRDELFHASLSRACKGHINKSFGVSGFVWLEIADMDAIETITKKYLNKSTIHNLMQKTAEDLFKKSNEAKDNSQVVTPSMARKFKLLEELTDKIGGNINAI